MINGAGVTGYYARVMSRGVADSLAASTFKLRLAFFVESLCDNTAHLSSTRPRPKFQGDCRHQMPKFEPRWPGAAAGRRPLAWPSSVESCLQSSILRSPSARHCHHGADRQRRPVKFKLSASGAPAGGLSLGGGSLVTVRVTVLPVGPSLSAQRRSRLPS